MSNILVALFASLIDRVFGEFRFMKHPIEIIGDIINYFEDKFYKDSISRGFFLLVFVVSITSFVSTAISLYLNEMNFVLDIIINSVIASMFLAHNMLYNSVKAILTAEDKRDAISQLVSRDTQDMDDSEVYKASIETYGENLSDGVVAPLFYLLLFGLVGLVVYKTINTLDSMVGYRDAKYENYGKVSAKVDDILNFIPARLTALLIALLSYQKPFAFYSYGKKHDSPNAGHPIAAMALAVDAKLGGDTYYFGKLKSKPYFGDASAGVEAKHLRDALKFRNKMDIALFSILLVILVVASW